MTQLFVNNFAATLTQTLGVADQYLHLSSAAGLPMLANSNYLLLTLYRKTGIEESGHEVVQVTAITDNMLTVVRAVEGVAATQFLTGDFVEARVTAGSFSAIAASVSAQLAAQTSIVNAQLIAQNTQAATQIAALSALVYAGL